MAQSKQTQPHYYLTLDIDMTDAMAFRQQLNAAASERQRVSVNDLIVKACAIALQRHPKFNAEFGEGGLKMHEAINIDIGIALDEGLIAPAILDCGAKSLGRIAEECQGPHRPRQERAPCGRRVQRRAPSPSRTSARSVWRRSSASSIHRRPRSSALVR